LDRPAGDESAFAAVAPGGLQGRDPTNILPQI